jgi:hypothetical protein
VLVLRPRPFPGGWCKRTSRRLPSPFLHSTPFHPSILANRLYPQPKDDEEDWDYAAPRNHGRMAFVPEGQADRSQARSAWDNATPKSRPVGYGVIRAGVRADSMMGVTKF